MNVNARDIVNARLKELDIDNRRNKARLWAASQGILDEGSWKEWKLGVQFEVYVLPAQIKVVYDVMGADGEWLGESIKYFSLDSRSEILELLAQVAKSCEYVEPDRKLARCS